ncbi:MAG: hypothetical protein H7338_06900, partial [Candidatus Sericytochromatia bacterium]|nr:hypothetical protein [Candidatus Sericytochromatia bacterium]
MKPSFQLLATSLFVGMWLSACAAPELGPTVMPAIGALSQPLLRLAPDLPKATGPKSAVLFAFVAMDDKLTLQGDKFLNALESTAGPELYTIAFADALGPDNSHLYAIEPDADAKTLASPRSFLSPTLKEVSSNDPATISGTLNWALTTYPAKFTALDFFAHGGGYLGLGTDATQVGPTKRSVLPLGDFGTALRQGLKGRKLDLINLLSCQMGNVETAYELRDLADVLIASEDNISAGDASTIAFTAELNRQLRTPQPDARVIGRQMAIFAEATQMGSDYRAISAVELARMDEIKRTVNVLTNDLLAAMPTHGEAILKAYDAVPNIVISNSSQRDLWTFCKHLNQDVNDPVIRKSSLAVKAAVKKALLHTRDRENERCQGLSICMPPRKDIHKIMAWPLFQASLNSQFAKATGWNRFIEAVKATVPA